MRTAAHKKQQQPNETQLRVPLDKDFDIDTSPATFQDLGNPQSTLMSKSAGLTCTDSKLETIDELREVLRLLSADKREGSAYQNPDLSERLDAALMSRFELASGESALINTGNKRSWRKLLLTILAVALMAFLIKFRGLIHGGMPLGFGVSISSWVSRTRGGPKFPPLLNEIIGGFPEQENMVFLPPLAPVVTPVWTHFDNLITSVQPELSIIPSAFLAPPKRSLYQRLCWALFTMLRSDVEIKKVLEQQQRAADPARRFLLPRPEMIPEALFDPNQDNACWPLFENLQGRLAFNLLPNSQILSVSVTMDSRVHALHRITVYGQLAKQMTIITQRPVPEYLAPDWVALGEAQFWGNGTGTVTVEGGSPLHGLEFKRVLIDFPKEQDGLHCVSHVSVAGHALV